MGLAVDGGVGGFVPGVAAVFQHVAGVAVVGEIFAEDIVAEAGDGGDCGS